MIFLDGGKQALSGRGTKSAQARTVSALKAALAEPRPGDRRDHDRESHFKKNCRAS